METNRKAPSSTTAAMYLRRSSTDERDRGGGTNRSIDGQRADLERLAQAHGLTIVAEFNEGAGVSASFLSDHERPQWDMALAELGNTYDVLLGWALDRLTREGMGDAAMMFDLVERQGGRVLTADGFDTANESGRIMGALMAEQARQESAGISKRVRRGKEGQRTRGEFLGGRPGYGLIGIKEDGKIVDLVVDHDKATAVTFAAELICDGASVRDACRALNERGDRTMSGNIWSVGTMRTTLTKPSLIGQRRYGEDVYRDDDGTPIQVHEPVMSEALWHRVNRTLSSRAENVRGTNRRRPRKTPKTLLTGLLRCAECGSSFHRNTPKKHLSYYRCYGCATNHQIMQGPTDDCVARAALNFLSSLDRDSAIIDEVGRRWLARFSPEQLGRHDTIQGELEALRDKAAELQVAYFERNSMETDVYERLEQRFTGQIDDLEKELRTTPKPNADLSPLFDLVQSSDDPDGDIVGEGSAWMALPSHQRREIIRCLVDEVTVERRPKPGDDIEDRLTIEFTTEENVIHLSHRSERVARADLDYRAQVADLKTA